VLRIFQSDPIVLSKNQEHYHNYVFISQTEHSLWFYDMIRIVYQMPPAKSQMTEVLLDSDQVPQSWLERIKSDPNLIVGISVYGFTEEQSKNLASVMTELGRTSCDISGKSNQPAMFQLWLPPENHQLCDGARSMY